VAAESNPWPERPTVRRVNSKWSEREVGRPGW
jgi:hypothetical protein